MEIYKDEIIQIEAFEEKKFMKITRLPNDDVETWKKSILMWAAYLVDYKPVYQLVDERKSEFLITPDLQEYINEKLIKVGIMNGTKRVALIQNDDIFVQTGVEQTLENEQAKPLDIRYFNDENLAEEWLFRPLL